MDTKLEDFIVKRSNIPKDFLKDFFNLCGNTYGDTYKNNIFRFYFKDYISTHHIHENL